MPSSTSNFPSSSSSSPSSGPAGATPASVAMGDDLLGAGQDAVPAGGADSTAAPGAEDPAGSEALDRWVERLHAGIDRLAEVAAPRLQRLQSGMSATRGTLRRQARLVREDGEEWAESLRCTVREHPVTAVAVAAAFGLLLARLSR